MGERSSPYAASPSSSRSRVAGETALSVHCSCTECSKHVLGATVTTTPKPFVFVLMPFDSSFDDVYAFGIKQACEDAGAYCERLDEQLFHESMVDRIYNQISKADLIVAEMSGRNPNVFYEVGYAHALGKPVVLLTREAADIPFDLRQRQHVVHGGSIKALRESLVRSIDWHLRNPGDVSDDAASELELRLEGQELATTCAIPVSRCRLPSSTRSTGSIVFVGRSYVRLVFSVFNASRRVFRTVSFTPQLITDSKFVEFGDATSGTPQPIASARLPEGRSAHRLPVAMSLEPGGHATFAFALFSNDSLRGAMDEPAVLRLLGDRPWQDWPLRFSLPSDA
jgi:hypothetical protein